jgi:predicted RNA-binding Zn ribbon-like protein
MHSPKNIGTITFDGGCLCFDFINTVSSRREETIIEYLPYYADLLTLYARQKALPATLLAALDTHAEKKPQEARKALAEIVVSRENMYQLFSTLAAGKTVPSEVLDTFNVDLPKLFSHLQFQNKEGLPQLTWKIESTDLYLPFRLALKSAYDILTTEEPRRIKECPACGWLFLDHSKNNSRRWCDMQVCGSIDKSKRYYHRKKQQ